MGESVCRISASTSCRQRSRQHRRYGDDAEQGRRRGARPGSRSAAGRAREPDRPEELPRAADPGAARAAFEIAVAKNPGKRIFLRKRCRVIRSSDRDR